MAGVVLCNSASHILHPNPKSPLCLLLTLPSVPNSLSLRFSTRKIRGLSVVTRVGPGTSTYIYAFVLPLSLIAITVFTSIRIADKLDRDFLEEMELNQAIMEASEEDGDSDEAGSVFLEVENPKPSLSRNRNRPKREAETSSL